MQLSMWTFAVKDSFQVPSFKYLPCYMTKIWLGKSDPYEKSEKSTFLPGFQTYGDLFSASFVTKFNKLNSSRGSGGSGQRGFFKTIGEFSLRENLYYGSIFFCMTLIVIVCFVVINTQGGTGHFSSGSASGGAGKAAAMFDAGKKVGPWQILIW